MFYVAALRDVGSTVSTNFPFVGLGLKKSSSVRGAYELAVFTYLSPLSGFCCLPASDSFGWFARFEPRSIHVLVCGFI